MPMSTGKLAELRSLLSPHVRTTPLIPASGFSSGERSVYLKPETLQVTGSFKFRAAMAGILTHMEEARARGVVASSSGNFALAVAYSTKQLGVRACLIIPPSSSPYKIERIRALGAHVILSGDTYADRVRTTELWREKTNGLLLQSHDSDESIAASTILGEELWEQAPRPFSVILPVSGGGLLAGVSLAVKNHDSRCEVFGVQPAGNQAMLLSLKEGRCTSGPDARTVADAVGVTRPGANAFPIIQHYADGVVAVPEDAIYPMVRRVIAEEKLIAEPAAVLPLIAISTGLVQPRNRTVIALLSGANLDLNSSWLFAKEL